MSEILALLYRGERPAAERLARTAPLLDMYEAAALGALEALIERAEEDPALVTSYASDGWTPLHLAAFFGNNAAAKELLRRGAEVNARSHNESQATPLHSACAGDHTVVAATLIVHGADVNATQTGGYRPLDSARRNNNPELIELLVEAGGVPGG